MDAKLPSHRKAKADGKSLLRQIGQTQMDDPELGSAGENPTNLESKQKKKKGRQRGSTNLNVAERDHLLDLVEQEEWQQVANSINLKFNNNRDALSTCRKRFVEWANAHIGTFCFVLKKRLSTQKLEILIVPHM